MISAPEPRNGKETQAVSWLLDADILSQPVKSRGNPAVIEWLEREQGNAFTSSIVIAQVAFWIRTKDGTARERLQRWLTLSLRAMEGRVLSFNVAVAHVWAEQKIVFVRAGTQCRSKTVHRRDGVTSRAKPSKLGKSTATFAGRVCRCSTRSRSYQNSRPLRRAMDRGATTPGPRAS